MYFDTERAQYFARLGNDFSDEFITQEPKNRPLHARIVRILHGQ
jgi:hypothetical protein